MMKRFLAMLLTLCLFAVPTAFAESADDAPLRVLDAWWKADSYQAQYPDRAIEAIETSWDDRGFSNESDILRSGDWDAACINTTDYSLKELNALGLTLDLGSVEATAAKAEGLYPSIRKGCSAGDTLVALPAGYLGTRTVSYLLLGTDYRGDEDAEGLALREQLGFTAEDQPKTFAEVCALGLRYMALSREQRKGTMFLFSDSVPQGFPLLYNMILTYQTEVTDESGNIEFDTPDFRAALQNADPLLAAFAADPKPTYAKDGSASLVLSDNTGLEQSYGAFPRVTQGDSIPAMMTVVIVNPNSKHLSEAIDYAMIAADFDQEAMVYYQNADYDEQLRKSYDRGIAAQIEEGEDQSVIDELEACKAVGDDKYFTPKRVFEHYAAVIEPKLVFPRWRSFGLDDAIFDYLQGKTDADGFIAALNASAAK